MNLTGKLREKLLSDLNFSELFRGAAVSLVFRGISIVAGYLFFFLVSRWFGAREVGVFSECWTLLMIASVVGRLGMDTAIVRFLGAEAGSGRTIFHRKLHLRGLIIVFSGSVVTGAILGMFAKQLSLIYFKTTADYNNIMMVAVAVIPFALMSFNAETVRGLKNIVTYNLYQNGSLYLAFVVCIGLFTGFRPANELPLQAFVLAVVIVMFFSFGSVYKGMSKVKILGLGDFQKEYPFRKILGVSFPMLLSNSLFLVMTWTDILVLGAFRNEETVGIYNIAVKIAALNTVVLLALNSIAAPKFAEIFASGNLSAFRRMVKQTSLLNVIATFPVFIIMLIFPGFLTGLFGAEFKEGVIALILLALGQFFNSFCGSTMHILNMTGYEKTGRNIMIVVAVVNLLLNLLLIPPYGHNGAAAATTVSAILWNLLAVNRIYHFHGFLTFPINLRKNGGI